MQDFSAKTGKVLGKPEPSDPPNAKLKIFYEWLWYIRV